MDMPYKIPSTKSLILDTLFKIIANAKNDIPTGTYLFLFNFFCPLPQIGFLSFDIYYTIFHSVL